MRVDRLLPILFWLSASVMIASAARTQEPVLTVAKAVVAGFLAYTASVLTMRDEQVRALRAELAKEE
jgi:hypothetical protein